MTDDTRVVIVGASVAGLATLEALRDAGHTGPVTVVGRELHAPYERPPLSKQVLRGEQATSELAVRTVEEIDSLGATWRTGVSAVGLDVEARAVTLGDGSRLDYDALVIATGLSARTLPMEHDPDAVITVRTIEDAVRLESRLTVGSTVAVVGAGFLGTEVAASARLRGCSVHLVDGEQRPLALLGETVADAVRALHAEQGVQWHLGQHVAGLVSGADGRTTITLADGTAVEADTVVVAIGGRPETSWLADSGLRIDDGVTCDKNGRAAAGVFAAGDVAAWFVPSHGLHVRSEHRMNAGSQGAHVAQALLGEDVPAPVVPYFWTDQYQSRIQVFGHLPAAGDPRAGRIRSAVTDGSVEEGRFAVAFHDGDDLVAGLTWNLPAAARAFRVQLTERLRAVY